MSRAAPVATSQRPPVFDGLYGPDYLEALRTRSPERGRRARLYRGRGAADTDRKARLPGGLVPRLAQRSHRSAWPLPSARSCLSHGADTRRPAARSIRSAFSRRPRFIQGLSEELCRCRHERKRSSWLLLREAGRRRAGPGPSWSSTPRVPLVPRLLRRQRRWRADRRAPPLIENQDRPPDRARPIHPRTEVRGTLGRSR